MSPEETTQLSRVALSIEGIGVKLDQVTTILSGSPAQPEKGIVFRLSLLEMRMKEQGETQATALLTAAALREKRMDSVRTLAVLLMASLAGWIATAIAAFAHPAAK